MNIAQSLSGLKNGSVANTPDALSTATSGLQKAAEQYNAYQNQAMELYAPYQKTGLASLDEYAKLLLGGVDALAGDQNFKAMQNLAEKKVMNNRAVSGLLRSGATANALDDTLLNFANTYYNSRLQQLQGGVQYGTYAADATNSIYNKLGTNATDLASAMANIALEREGQQNTLKAAQMTADANKYAAENTGGLFGHGGFLGLGG